MKNLFKVFGIIALAAVIGFSFAACGGDDDGGVLDAPTGLTATALSSTEIRLTWNAVPGAAGYNVYKSSNASSGFEIGTTSTTNSVTNNGLPPNTTFYYKVAAYSANGEGAMSSVVSATTLPTSGGGVAKTIVITGVPTTYQYGAIALYPVGTTVDDVANETVDAVAASEVGMPGASVSTYPLYGMDDNPWTGSGSYAVYWLLKTSSNSSEEKLYRASSVFFTAATTTVAFSQFTEITGGIPNYSINGIWECGGVRITVSGSIGVISSFNTIDALWQDAVNKNYVTLGGQWWRNITSTGNLTWSGQVLEVTYYTSNPNVAIGTRWIDTTFTLSADGQTLTDGYNTWTRKQ